MIGRKGGVNNIVDAWHALLLSHNAIEIQEASNDSDRETLRELRHHVPEEINRRIAALRLQFPDTGIGKVATDIAVPGDTFETMMTCYEAVLTEAQIPYAIWGHIGNHHVHVNMLPQNPKQHADAKNLLLLFAQKAKELGGTITAEHGVGKIKLPQLEMLFSEEDLRDMAAVKRALDPYAILNPGTTIPTRLLAD